MSEEQHAKVCELIESVRTGSVTNLNIGQAGNNLGSVVEKLSEEGKTFLLLKMDNGNITKKSVLLKNDIPYILSGIKEVISISGAVLYFEYSFEYSNKVVKRMINLFYNIGDFSNSSKLVICNHENKIRAVIFSDGDKFDSAAKEMISKLNNPRTVKITFQVKELEK